MISPWAVKLFIVHLCTVGHYLLLNPDLHQYVSSSPLVVDDAISAEAVNITGLYYHTMGQQVYNSSVNALVLKSSMGTSVCDEFRLIAPRLGCVNETMFSVADFTDKVDMTLIGQLFGLNRLDLADNFTIYLVSTINKWDERTIMTSFNSQMVGLDRPIVFTDACMSSQLKQHCETRADWEAYFADIGVSMAEAAVAEAATRYLVAPALRLVARTDTFRQVVSGFRSYSAASNLATATHRASSIVDIPMSVLHDVTITPYRSAASLSDIVQAAPSAADAVGYSRSLLSTNSHIYSTPSMTRSISLPNLFVSGVGTNLPQMSHLAGSSYYWDIPHIVYDTITNPTYMRGVAASNFGSSVSLDALRRTTGASALPGVGRALSLSSSSAATIRSMRAATARVLQAAASASRAFRFGTWMRRIITSLKIRVRRSTSDTVYNPNLRKTNSCSDETDVTSPTNVSIFAHPLNNRVCAVCYVYHECGGSPECIADGECLDVATRIKGDPPVGRRQRPNRGSAVQNVYSGVYDRLNSMRRTGTPWGQSSADRVSRHKRGIGAKLGSITWSGVKLTYRSIVAIPPMGWVGLSGLITSLADIPYLLPEERPTFIVYPTVFLSLIERTYAVPLSLALNNCYATLTDSHRQMIDDPNEFILYGAQGRKLFHSDVVFNLTSNEPGMVLRSCHWMFKNKVEGLSDARIRIGLSTLFNLDVQIGEIIFWNGPPSYVTNDFPTFWELGGDNLKTFPRPFQIPMEDTISVVGYTKYLGAGPSSNVTHVFPKFPKRYRRRPIDSGTGERDVMLVKREYPAMSWMSSRVLSNRIMYIGEEPTYRHEWDLMQSAMSDSVSYVNNLHARMSSVFMSTPTDLRPFSVNQLESLDLKQTLLTVRPFDLSVPRLNIMRELTRTIDFENHLIAVGNASIDYGISLSATPLRNIYACYAATSADVIDDDELVSEIHQGTIDDASWRFVLKLLYKDVFYRIPIVIVVREKGDIQMLRDSALFPVRTSDSFDSWKYYSPILITDDIGYIDVGMFSLCISPSESGVGVKRGRPRRQMEDEDDGIPVLSNRPGRSRIGRLKDAATKKMFRLACLHASRTVYYQKEVTEVATNYAVPSRLRSLLSGSHVDQNVFFGMNGTYTDILSHLSTSGLLHMVKPDVTIRGVQVPRAELITAEEVGEGSKVHSWAFLTSIILLALLLLGVYTRGMSWVRRVGRGATIEGNIDSVSPMLYSASPNSAS